MKKLCPILHCQNLLALSLSLYLSLSLSLSLTNYFLYSRPARDNETAGVPLRQVRRHRRVRLPGVRRARPRLLMEEERQETQEY